MYKINPHERIISYQHPKSLTHRTKLTNLISSLVRTRSDKIIIVFRNV